MDYPELNFMKITDLADLNKIEYTDVSSAVGCYEIGFTRENALLIATEIRQENIPIIGGDVYYLNNGEINVAYDHWDCSEKEDDETLRQYIERSYQATIDYITKYREERFSYFWKIPIRKRWNCISKLDGVPLFVFVIPAAGKKFCGCLFY